MLRVRCRLRSVSRGISYKGWSLCIAVSSLIQILSRTISCPVFLPSSCSIQSKNGSRAPGYTNLPKTSTSVQSLHKHVRTMRGERTWTRAISSWLSLVKIHASAQEVLQEQTTDEITPLTLRPPKVILGGPWSEKWTSGLWLLGFHSTHTSTSIHVYGQTRKPPSTYILALT
ncbi:hypothetical protein EV361DRAFT_575438 [Lentinula raphanica]|nr:hypothetical protein EV361DRAFT_575438 [Lentinula raphanica]